jgi:hypothetical protein
MAIDLPEPYHRSLFGKHTFSCALTTRGGICDCLPPPASEAGPTVALVGTGYDQPSVTSGPKPMSAESARRRAARTRQREIAARERAERLLEAAERLTELGRGDLAAIAHDRAERARRCIGA